MKLGGLGRDALPDVRTYCVTPARSTTNFVDVQHITSSFYSKEFNNVNNSNSSVLVSTGGRLALNIEMWWEFKLGKIKSKQLGVQLKKKQLIKENQN